MKQYDEGTDIAGCQDSTALASFEAVGYVPWTLFSREREWREELQTALATILDPGLGSVRWCETPEAVVRAREIISDLMAQRIALRDELAEVERKVDTARDELEQARADVLRVRAHGIPLAEVPYDGCPLEEYLNRCRGHAVRQALAHSKDTTQAAALLSIGRSTLYRHMETYGLSEDSAAQSA